ncbi:MAG: guanylate kinase [Deltaproteobacteria bacterium]|nr:guanylate kinase [Deltaproteobacteria bacterium]
MRVDTGELFIVCSPSGAGKTTLCRRLLERFGDMRFSVSHTTRRKRPQEVEGRDYHFVDQATFDGMAQRGEFAEWAVVHGNRYGTSNAEIRKAAEEGRAILFDVDFQGAAQIRVRYPSAAAIFILPPSLGELRRRLEQRGTETRESLELRYRNALREIEAYPQFDFLVVNDDVERAVETLVGIVLAERARRTRRAAAAERLLAEAGVSRSANSPRAG